jgi:hypothetical protein
MNIDKITSYVQMSRTASIQPTAARPIRGLDEAKQATQTRLTDAAKGFVQAAKVRDGVAAADQALNQAQELVKKAGNPSLTASDRKNLQEDFTKALAAVDQGAKNQIGATADKTLANSINDPKRVGTVSADRLGQGASKTFSSVADLKKLDLNTANPDQLAEAAKVLEAAKGETGSQLTIANQQVDRISGRLDKLEGVQNALEGKPNLTGKQQRQVDILQALQQQTSAVTPGSLFNTVI